MMKRLTPILLLVAVMLWAAAPAANAYAQAVDDYPTLSGQAWNAPATHAAAVTPSDISDLSDVSRWLYVGSAGDLAVIGADGITVTLPAVPTGALLPIRVSRVMATGTTAGDIVVFW